MEIRTVNINLAERIAIIVMALLIYIPIVMIIAGLRITATLQCNRREYIELQRLERIAFEHGNFVPMRYRYNEWAKNHPDYKMQVYEEN